MILWSIVPIETVLEGYDDPSRQAKLEAIEYRGATLMVEWIGYGQMRIHRLISPRPADYLREDFSPGKILDVTQFLM
ncbi:MAG: YlzJ-like family protein [Acidibacillus sp.]|uniref:YlzJ-like protein n=1 Tax=Sulfoacidibacillus ferrooxidans TaxID=2005001 RepID=A0A9X1V9E3_9BACL|nr:YlzJ-like family protein [Sulfoacidibacillus ferrooxidans]MCI0183644.1 hypothetical protein [Sulfoacidibacillus ferrooxidans]MCY0892035.1 YlzJ-like family protein [Acidibacillus sp.]